MEEEEERREEYDIVNQSLTIIKNAVRRQKKLSKFPEIKVNKSSTARSRQQITDWQIIISSSGCYNYKHTIKTIIIQIIPTMIKMIKKNKNNKNNLSWNSPAVWRRRRKLFVAKIQVIWKQPFLLLLLTLPHPFEHQLPFSV